MIVFISRVHSLGTQWLFEGSSLFLSILSQTQTTSKGGDCVKSKADGLHSTVVCSLENCLVKMATCSTTFTQKETVNAE